ncbi:MAG: N-acetylmuramoyl-L-alanine amidase [Marivibrio sp.]|uniref:N-acetylmuramoyl-L-alanine amidase n=1 Tax=Marivibrio sp. TaxID=2039719 RepID=UPI0032F004EF
MTAPAIVDSPSPNFGDRRPLPDGSPAPIDMLVLHYTDMESADASLARLTDPAAEVSAHYLIDEDGAVHRLVDEEKRAWHAGLAHWRGTADVNSRSIGIELQNPGHSLGYRPFPEAQIAALIALARDILARRPIPARNVLGHSDVAPDRKVDPGELLPWARLAAAGVGLFPAAPTSTDRSIHDLLAEIGYDPGAKKVVDAFQRRFRPARIDGRVDAETTGLAAAYLALCNEDAEREADA